MGSFRDFQQPPFEKTGMRHARQNSWQPQPRLHVLAPAQKHLVDIHLLPAISSITILGTACRCREVHNLLIFKTG